MITVGNYTSLSSEDIEAIKELVSFNVPEDYLSFLQEYGYGSVNDLLLLELPDEEFVKNNFQDYMDFWEWENKKNENEAIHSLRIAGTIDGDIICCINSQSVPYLIMPRHSDKPVYLESLEDVFSFYQKEYDLKELYFMSNRGRKNDSVFLWDDHLYDPEMMTNVRKEFLKMTEPDICFDPASEEMNSSIYIFLSIGGSVHFDEGTKITIDYQTVFKEEALKLTDLVKACIESEYRK